MAFQRTNRSNVDVNLNLPRGQTAVVLAGMSERGQQSFVNAAARQGIATPSRVGGSQAGGSRRSNGNSIRGTVPASHVGGSQAVATQPYNNQNSSAGGAQAAGGQWWYNAVSNAGGSQRGQANNQLVRYGQGSQRGASQAGANNQLVPYAGSQRRNSNSGRNGQLAPAQGNTRTGVAGQALTGGLAAIVEEVRPVAATRGGDVNLNLQVINVDQSGGSGGIVRFGRRPRRRRDYYDDWDYPYRGYYWY